MDFFFFFRWLFWFCFVWFGLSVCFVIVVVVSNGAGLSFQKSSGKIILGLMTHSFWRSQMQINQSTGTGCPERLWSLLLWRYSRPAWTPTWATFSRELALSGGLDPMISRGPFQPLQFCDSVILLSFLCDVPTALLIPYFTCNSDISWIVVHSVDFGTASHHLSVSQK